MRPTLKSILERAPRAFWIGIGGAAVVTLVGLLGFHDGSLWRAPGVLQTHVEAALREAGYAGLEVEMNGQDAILHGLLATTPAIAAAQHAAQASAGAGGLWAGGVTRTDVSDVKVGAVDAPFSWRIRRDGAAMVLSGAVPSERTRAALMQAATGAFPNAPPRDDMHIAGGAPDPRWGQAARGVIRNLALLTTGEARMVDGQIAFIGDGGAEAVARLRERYAAAPENFRVRIEASVDGQDTTVPELQGIDWRSGGAQACGQAFTRLLANKVINFASGSADIDPSSRALLDALASVALRCDRYAIAIAGHTDNVGAREMNIELSRSRADAVARYLVSQGVSGERLRPDGYGPDHPIASNDTPAGQAANRRIEFDVAS